MLYESSGSFLSADISLSDCIEKIGNLEISFDPKVNPQNRSIIPQDLNVRTVVTQKRKQQNLKRVTPKKKTNQSAPNFPDSGYLPENLLVSKVSPDSLINVTQSLTTGDKSFICSICNYTSIYKQSAKRHIQLMHLPKTTVFKCQMCEYTTSLKYHLKGHYTGKHGISEEAARKLMSD